MLKTRLIEQIYNMPDSLQSLAEDFVNDLLDKLSPEQSDVLLQNQQAASIVQVFCCSEFVRNSCLLNPDLLVDLFQSGDLFSSQRRQQYAEALDEMSIDSEAALMSGLRRFRRREMVRIAWRDLAGWSELDETLRDLTALAECCIQKALDYFYQQACDRRGTPVSKTGRPLNIVVLGMGKLGAYELNYSSDIDLIFAFEEEGVLPDRKQTTYGEFFTRICRSLVKALDELTVDGFVFRTDTRLRPFGDSGPLIMTFDGMENYYLTQAREWERYAMIKARQVAGDFVSGQKLMAMLKPFVYRRYLDYGAFEELRNLKAQINRELMRKDKAENIKLGPGGIREIEFIGQAFQLIRGGQEPLLQQREIQKILPLLAELNLMGRQETDTLLEAYRFLRRVENHIQEYQDKQTHDLPADPLVQKILAFSLGYKDWEAFKQALDSVRLSVHRIFEDVFSLSDNENDSSQCQNICSQDLGDEDRLKLLAQLGFEAPETVLNALTGFMQSSSVKRLSAKSLDVVEKLLPKVVEAVAGVDNPDETLTRLLKLFEVIAGRNVYFSLLAENPEALSQLVRLSSASQWICDYLAQYPVLLDELLDPRSLYEPLSKKDLAQQLAEQLSRFDELDEEQLMIQLREFKHLNVLRVAAADIMNVIPVMVVSDYLTWIAEVILTAVVDKAWLLMVNKHGLPSCAEKNGDGFAVVGMGKLGGIELGYGSDLDMVFLYDCADVVAMTQGEKPVSNMQFYMRLGQKIRHILDTRMLSGVLYEVDLRLRPNGDSGLLVSHIQHYETYLQEDAWTWEHQALIRGRLVCGDPVLGEQFSQIREKVLALPRDIDTLKQDVREMREKIHANLAPKDSEVFHLKHSKGGILDIEFIVQFGVLANACGNRALLSWTDNIRLLDGLAECGFLQTEEAELLKQAYCQYRDYGHRLVLQGRSLQISNDEFIELRGQVIRLWLKIME